MKYIPDIGKIIVIKIKFRHNNEFAKSTTKILKIQRDNHYKKEGVQGFGLCTKI